MKSPAAVSATPSIEVREKSAVFPSPIALLYPVFHVGQDLMAFVTTFLAQTLLGTFDLHLVALGLLNAITALYTSHRFWHFAVRQYSIASSRVEPRATP